MKSKHHIPMIQEINHLYAMRKGLDKHFAIFGSARLNEDHPACKDARELARLLSEDGINIATGGGPAIMASASRGAKEGKNGLSISHTIQLPFEEEVSPWVDHSMEHSYFAIRKFGLIQQSCGSAFFCGGWGTLDELAAISCLITTGKMRKNVGYPIVMFGTQFWDGLFRWVEEVMLPAGTISESDLDLFHFTDSAEEAHHFIVQSFNNQAAKKFQH